MERERVESIQPQDLVEKAKLGDSEAFGELVAQHQHEVFTLAVRLMRDRDLAADVSQDAFIRAWRAMPKFRGDAKFSTWMHRITVNTAWTHRSKQKRVRLDPLESMAVEPWSHSEISDHLDISVTAAKVRLHRGRKELRHLLDGYQDGAP
jgi:RNA polymerase sigma-70 factor (ECF subfamily)